MGSRDQHIHRVTRVGQTGTLVFCLAALGACDSIDLPAFLQPTDDGEAISAGAVQSGTTRLAERDVEAPEIFEAREEGLWDGRPSLGGVWVAHPGAKDPERVIIRNEKNGQFVIGALFRKERETPGPRLQISSDAAAALDILAGAPTQVHVVALKREEAPEVVAPPAPDDLPLEGALDAPSTVATTELDSIGSANASVAEIAASVLDEPAPAAAAAAPSPAPVATPRPSPLDKPFIQLGIFSVEANANNTAQAMRQRGLIPTVRKQSSSGKTFWRVIVGPAMSRSERAEILSKIKSAGFEDAYAVTN